MRRARSTPKPRRRPRHRQCPVSSQRCTCCQRPHSHHSRRPQRHARRGRSTANAKAAASGSSGCARSQIQPERTRSASAIGASIRRQARANSPRCSALRSTSCCCRSCNAAMRAARECNLIAVRGSRMACAPRRRGHRARSRTAASSASCPGGAQRASSGGVSARSPRRSRRNSERLSANGPSPSACNRERAARSSPTPSATKTSASTPTAARR